MKTILQSQDNVIVVSGHDHNLQYIDNDNIKNYMVQDRNLRQQEQ
jgi:hypothetical protein